MTEDTAGSGPEVILKPDALLALHSAPPSEPSVSIRTEQNTGLGEHGEQSLIQVVDNGPGVDPDVLERLTLEPVTTRAASGGSGMGLVFCRRVMNSLGGSIKVASVQGIGTTVSLYFKSGEDSHAKEKSG